MGAGGKQMKPGGWTFRTRCLRLLILLGLLLIFLQMIVSLHYDQIKDTAIAHYENYKKIREVYQNKTQDVARRLGRYIQQTDTNNSSEPRVEVSLQNTTVPWVERIVHDTPGHAGHAGFELAAHARATCANNHFNSIPGSMGQLHILPSKRILYCPMEKIGTTFWRRVFYMFTHNQDPKFKQPYDVPIQLALSHTSAFTQTAGSPRLADLLSKNSFSFLFVRNPYSRLLSAFIDKLVPPNPFYWKVFGTSAVSRYRHQQGPDRRPPTGHDITFAEFVKFVVSQEKARRTDPHFVSIKKQCRPCGQNYKYIGRMETFKDDALYIMKQMGMNISIKVLEPRFINDSIDDAITDSIRSPFSWKPSVTQIISWDKALQRIWLKLQMRGIIAWSKKLDTSYGRLNNISVDQFINMVRVAHRQSDPAELKAQKDQVKKEAYASVPLQDIKAFRDLYNEDFVLFKYEASPSYIFDRGDEAVPPKIFFNYTHLT